MLLIAVNADVVLASWNHGSPSFACASHVLCTPPDLTRQWPPEEPLWNKVEQDLAGGFCSASSRAANTSAES